MQAEMNEVADEALNMTESIYQHNTVVISNR